MLILRLSLIMAMNVVVLGLHGVRSSVLPEPTTTSNTGGSIPSQNFDEETFASTWKINDITLGQNSSFSFNTSDPGSNPPDTLVLAQTNAGPSGLITQENTWWIVLLQTCAGTNCETVSFELGRDSFNSLSYTFVLQEPRQEPLKEPSQNPLSGFFFCIAKIVNIPGEDKNIECHSYSPTFDINPAGSGPKPGSPDLGFGADNKDTSNSPEDEASTSRAKIPTSVLLITTMDPYINVEGATATSVPAFTSTLVVVTATSIATATPNSVGSTNVESSAGGGGGKKLSVGAIVGIALGAFVLAVLVALAVLFFCRRSKQHRRTRLASGAGREPVMFAGSMDGVSNSRELFNDKDAAVQTLIHPNSNDSSFLLQDSNNRHSVQRHTFSPEGAAAYRDSPQDSAVVGISAHDSPTLRDTEHSDHENESQPLQRHVDISPYDTTSSAPYTGTAASPPRRKPTTASRKTVVSALSHSLSTSSTHSSQSPHSPSAQYTDFHHPQTHQHHSQLRGIGEEGGTLSTRNVSTTNPKNKNTGSSGGTTTTSSNSNSSGSRQLHSSNTNNEGELRYGDTRHTPQVFTHHQSSSTASGGGGGGGTTTLQSPFLSEPGMSPEEVARLEDEEARIDAAILAADEARRERSSSGLR